MIYYPHKWALLKITGTNPHYRVLGSWFGGYLDADEWRINSGIKSIEETDEYYIFKGYTESEYYCHKGDYGYSMIAYNIAMHYIKNSGGLIELLENEEESVQKMLTDHLNMPNS